MQKKNGRSGTAFAIISKNTLALYTSENIKYNNPKNWSKTIENAKFFQRCHIIGYRLSAKINEPNNIFIGTQYLNRHTMYDIEEEIYIDVFENKRKYIYKVTPTYKFDNDIVPIGVLIEAETIDKLEKKTYCRFCYNIQDGHKINYLNGSNMPIEKVLEEFSEKLEDEENKKNTKRKNDYKINIRTKVFHRFSNPVCYTIANVDPKYIQETTAYNKEDVIARGFDFCKKCTNYYKNSK